MAASLLRARALPPGAARLLATLRATRRGSNWVRFAKNGMFVLLMFYL